MRGLRNAAEKPALQGEPQLLEVAAGAREVSSARRAVHSFSSLAGSSKYRAAYGATAKKSANPYGV